MLGHQPTRHAPHTASGLRRLLIGTAGTVVLVACSAAAADPAPETTSAPVAATTGASAEPSTPSTIGGVGLLPGPLPTEPIEVIASTTTLPVPEEEVGLEANGNRILMLGDSILASTSSRYSNDMCDALVPLGWQVEIEAEVSRGIDFGQKVQQTRLDEGWDAGLVFLGSNHGEDENDFFKRYNDVLTTFGDIPIVAITTTQFRDSQVRINEIITATAAAHPNVTLLDWTTISTYPGVLGDDGLHLSDKGRLVLADAVANILGVAPAQPGDCLKSVYTDDSAGSVTGGPNTGKHSPGATSTATTVKPTSTTSSGTSGEGPSTSTGSTGSTGTTGTTTGTGGGTGTTNPPGTNPPGTNPPATNPPATSPPATNPPATNPPATNPPATDPPVAP